MGGREGIYTQWRVHCVDVIMGGRERGTEGGRERERVYTHNGCLCNYAPKRTQGYIRIHVQGRSMGGCGGGGGRGVSPDR